MRAATPGIGRPMSRRRGPGRRRAYAIIERMAPAVRASSRRLVAALLVCGLGFRLAKGRPRPFLAERASWSARTDIDAPLVIGSTLFGAGWGLVGLCPGPALENLASLSPRVIVFVVAMAAGMVLQDLWQRPRLTTRHEQRAALVADG